MPEPDTPTLDMPVPAFIAHARRLGLAPSVLLGRLQCAIHHGPRTLIEGAR
jgi:hypothetical protein